MAATLCTQRVLVEQVALLGPSARIADHAGGAAGQRDRVVAGQLEPPQHDQTDQIAVWRLSADRIHAVVQRQRAGRQTLGQRGAIGRVVDQAAGVEIGE